MSPADVRYLSSLVRMDVRKKERALAAFRPRDGQSAVEAADVHAKFVRDLEFRRGVLDRLRAER